MLNVSADVSFSLRLSLRAILMALLPGVSSVGDVELSTDEEGDRGRAAADDLMCLLVTQDQSEGDIMNKLSH